MVHGKEGVVVGPLSCFLNQKRVAQAHIIRTSEENHCCGKVFKITSLVLVEELVEKEEAKEVEEPGLEDTFGIGAANEGDLAGRALDKAYLEVPLYGALSNDCHWFLPSSNNLHCFQLAVSDSSCEAAKGCLGHCMNFHTEDFPKHIGPD